MHLQSVLLDRAETIDRVFDLGQRDVHVRIVIGDGSLPTLTCSVKEEAGRPADEAFVLVFPADLGAWVDAAMPSRRLRFGFPTDSRFVAADLAPGDYLVVALRGEVPPLGDPDVFARLSRSAIRVSVRPGRLNEISVPVRDTDVAR